MPLPSPKNGQLTIGPTIKVRGVSSLIVGLGSELGMEFNRLIGGRVLSGLRARKCGVPGIETEGVCGTEGGTAGFFEE